MFPAIATVGTLVAVALCLALALICSQIRLARLKMKLLRERNQRRLLDTDQEEQCRIARLERRLGVVLH